MSATISSSSSSSKWLLPLMLVIVFATLNLSSAQVIQLPPLPAAHGFDLKRLIGIDWYEIFFFSNRTSKLDACDRYVFTPKKDGSIIMQYAFHEPGMKGPLEKRTILLRPASENACDGIYTPIGGSEDQRVFALDYDENYEWVIIVDNYNYGGFVSVLSRTATTSKNLALIQRGVDLAEKYRLYAQYLALHDSKKCDYDNILAILKRDRKRL